MSEIESLELKISKFLRGGVILSAILMFTGWIMHLKWEGNPFFHFETYDRIPFGRQLAHYLSQHEIGFLLCYAGLIVLISLPLIRVLLTGVLFIKQKEYLLSLVAFIVLLGLAISFVFGIEL